MTSLTLPAPGSAGAWVMAVRPQTLPVAVAPVLVGAAISGGLAPVRWGAVLAALLGSLLLQIGSNLANDVFDHEKGTDNETRIGPARAVQKGLLSGSSVKRAMWLVFALAVLVGLYLTYVAGVGIVVLGLAAIISAIAYTGGPYPLGYHGLGDFFVFGFFGVAAVVGTTFVATGILAPEALLAAVSVGALATAVLVVNNVRDAATDVVTNKRTLVVRFGRRFGLFEYGLLVVLSGLGPAIGVALGWFPALALLGALTLGPGGWLTLRLVRAIGGPAHNALLANTAKLMLAHSVLFALGLWLGR